MSMNEIGIIGKGKMGRDIFNHLLPFDYKLNLLCRKAEDAAALTSELDKQLSKMRKRGLLSDEDYERKKQTIKISHDVTSLQNCDCIIESVIEDKNIKQNIFKEVAQVVSRDCILASNTSSIPLHTVFHHCDAPERCLGIHFFFPIKLIRTVEVNVTSVTDPQVIKKVKELLIAVDKKPFELKEEAHCVLNKIYLALFSQAYKIYEEKYLTIEELDQFFKEHLLTFGLFEIIDSAGLDIIVESIENFMTPRHTNLYTPLLKKGQAVLQAGYKGGQQGNGIAVYEQDYPPARKSLDPQCLEKYKRKILLKMQSLLINEIAYLVEQKYVEANEIGDCVHEVLGLAEHPFSMAERVGKQPMKECLLENFSKTRDLVYQPVDSFYAS